MKDIGIIGTGKNAATWYFKKCQQVYQRLNRSDAVCPVKLVNIPFEPINAILPDQMEEAGRLLLPHLREMDNFGVIRFILANITLHEAIDLQKENIKLKTPFVSLRTGIANHWDSKIKKAMIVGSYYTMQNEYLPSLFNGLNLEFIQPEKNDFKAIDQLRITYYKSKNHEAAKGLFDRLKNNYPEVESFIIACTEHALALDDYRVVFKSFNLPELQCLDLVEDNLEKRNQEFNNQ